LAVTTIVFVEEKDDAEEQCRRTLIVRSTMTVFIADTNDGVRHSLASIVASVEGMTVAGEASEVGDAIGGIKRAKPDSVIVALPLSGGRGLDVLSVAKSVDPASVAIMLTQVPCSECERKCFAMGADYFFDKTRDIKKIVTTLVLLAHQSPQQKPVGGRETAPRLVRSLLDTSVQTKSIPSTVPENCPRIVASPGVKSNECFLAGGASPASSRPILR
jgi:DNA-binding NarL/FixJ family response regulator